MRILTESIVFLHQLLSSKVCKNTSRLLASGMNTLSQAESSLQKYIDDNNCDLELKKEIDRMKKHLNAKLSRILSQVASMIEKHEYTELVTIHKEISLLYKSLRKYIYPINCKKIKEVNNKYYEAIESVPTYADRFFTSSFRESTILIVVLCSLKSASTAKDPKYSILTELYHETTMSVSMKISEALENICNCVSRSQCFDDAVSLLTTLDRQLESGLKEYISESVISQSKFQLEKWKEEQRKHDCSMDYDKNGEIVVKKWAEALDRCDPSKFSNDEKKWLTGTDYNKLRS